ncbi:hypothetical protein J14TS2_30640 [Bacillus sp. J14TS2]|uniref:DUF4340 domain-containing protein n=1 Tax=Bacillus sp. J14TS2 TaxID=2807188 RepID=UPI001B031563|nr:DUF4340 domain-containing protein [Bacillus sp. J14TS2]GIN72589.1 hypothetical protein J14TS2_30640 [Bacillus sp. J14TS2]
MRRLTIKTTSLLIIFFLIISSLLVILAKKESQSGEQVSRESEENAGETRDNQQAQPVLSIQPDQVHHITLQDAEETIELSPDSPYSEEEVRTNLSGWYIHQPYRNSYSVKYNPLVNMIYGIEELEWEEIIGEEKNLEMYGLETPDMKLTFQSEEGEETLILGDQTGDGKRYAKLSDSEQVGTIVEDVLQPYQLQAFELVEKFVKIIAIDVLDQLQISDGDQEIVIKIDHQFDQDGQGSPVFFINDQEVGEDIFRNLYKDIAGLSVHDVVKNATYHTPEATMTYTIFRDDQGDKSEINVELVSYDQDNFAVFLNGKADFLLGKSVFKNMLEKIKQT